MTYLLDTDICIYILNRPTPNLRSRFEKEPLSELGVSILTEAELYYGALHSSKPKNNRDRVESLLSPLTRLPFDSDAAGAFASIKENLAKRGKMIGAIDMLIAAVARSKNLTLITNNLKHFGEIQGLSIENWL